MPSPRIDRRAHWLRRTKTSKRPIAILVIDCESDIARPSPREEDHTFRLAVGAFCVYQAEGGLVDREWRDLFHPAELWQWVDDLSRQYGKLDIVAHNMDYDARVSRAFRYLPSQGWRLLFAVFSESCTIVEWERDKSRLRLLDSMNWLPSSLAELGQSIGESKIEIDFTTAQTGELLERCRQDVRILVEVLRQYLAFLDEHNLGSFGVTLARQAFTAYKHRFMPCKIGIHNSVAAVELERAAFRGGRVEVFRVGKLPQGQYYKLDVNGLYAAMMTFYPYPCRFIKVIENVRPEYLWYLLQRYLCIAEVILDAKEAKYPSRVQDRNCYPTGAFATTMTTPELREAILSDEVKGIGRVALYEPADLFSGFIEHFTNLRQEYRAAGNLAWSKFCKITRNALQGKFGQRGYSQEIIGESPIHIVKVRKWYDPETNQECTDLTLGGRVMRQTQVGESYESFPAIPAHVSGYGRLYMWSLLKMAGAPNVFYMDTDSLLVNKAGFLRLATMIDPTRLGYLKLEGRASDVNIRARKDYKFGQTDVIKGIRSTARRIGPSKFRQWHFTSIRYGLRVGDLDSVKVYQVEKTLARSITVGKVGLGGWITPPHLRLDPDSTRRTLTVGDNHYQWRWEVDRDWLIAQDRFKSLRWRLAFGLRWESAPVFSPFS